MGWRGSYRVQQQEGTASLSSRNYHIYTHKHSFCLTFPDLDIIDQKTLPHKHYPHTRTPLQPHVHHAPHVHPHKPPLITHNLHRKDVRPREETPNNLSRPRHNPRAPRPQHSRNPHPAPHNHHEHRLDPQIPRPHKRRRPRDRLDTQHALLLRESRRSICARG